jgi:nickel-dependent lactate racemase
MVTGTGSDKGFVSEAEAGKIVTEGLKPIPLDGKKVLVLTPDSTRTAPLPFFFRLLVELLKPRVKKLDFMIALGTHPLMSEERINTLFGLTAKERREKYGDINIYNHAWNDPAELETIGALDRATVKRITGGLMEEDVPVSINRRVLQYDEVLVLGPTFPHEVVGFSGGYKYFFPGVCGAEFLNFFHWLGAVITNVRIIGVKDTPVRRMITEAMKLVPVARHCISLVTTTEGLKGVFVGTPEEAYDKAADLSSTVHIVYKPRPYKFVLAIAPEMYDDIWTAGKGMYKLEPVVREGGTLVIYAPHVTEVSYTHGKVIDDIGYHCRDYFTAQMAKFSGVPRGVMAHSTHVRGCGTFLEGVEKCNVNVVLATGIPEARCKKINLGFMDPSTVKVSQYEGREDEGILVVHHAGEVLHRLESERPR